MKSVVIIGGGFSGTLTAVNLARLSSAPVRVSVIDKGRAPCRGIAYSTRNPNHLLNVAARNMSALADQPHHFVEWLRTRAEYLDEPLLSLKESFVPRRTYGDYLHGLFHWHCTIPPSETIARLEWIADEATDIVVNKEHATVHLAGGGTMMADKVVLAVGNQAPSRLRLPSLNMSSPKYIGNPWQNLEEQLPSKNEDVLLIGSSLTMVDVFLSLQDLGWQGKIYAVSRNGLLPASHFKGMEHPDLLEDGADGITLRKMFSIFRRHYAAARAGNINPAILVDKLRPFTQRIWQNFSAVEKRRFNRHLRTRWNVTRHRIAPAIHRQLRDALSQQRLELIRGRLRDCREEGGKLSACVESGGTRRVIVTGALINCTGPRESYTPPDNMLFGHLFERGIVQADDINTGIKATADFSVVDREGKSSDILFALGALLKGTLMETTAVPELRSQAFRIAEKMAGQLAANRANTRNIAEVVEDVIEYSI